MQRVGDPQAHIPIRAWTGRRAEARGYVLIRRPEHPLADRHGYVYEHRLVAWEAGLLPDPSCHVHHINENKADNCLENLEVLTPGEHAIEHNLGTVRPRQVSKVCPVCTLAFMASRSDAVFCSHKCQTRAFRRRHGGQKARSTVLDPPRVIG